MSIPLPSAFLYDGQEVFARSDCPLDLGTDLLVGNTVFVSDAWYLAVTHYMPHVVTILSNLHSY